MNEVKLEPWQRHWVRGRDKILTSEVQLEPQQWHERKGRDKSQMNGTKLI